MAGQWSRCRAGLKKGNGGKGCTDSGPSCDSGMQDPLDLHRGTGGGITGGAGGGGKRMAVHDWPLHRTNRWKHVEQRG